jgi:hypothetical protein
MEVIGGWEAAWKPTKGRDESAKLWAEVVREDTAGDERWKIEKEIGAHHANYWDLFSVEPDKNNLLFSVPYRKK